jgi:ABC-type transporter Mla subunit MlaD
MSLTEVLVVIAVILLVVIVGAAVPPLLQLRSTLKSLATFLDETRPKLGAALDQVTEAAGRISRTAAGIEEEMGKFRGVIDTIAAFGKSLEIARENLRKTTTVMGAIGPAFVAGLRALWPAGGGVPAPAADPPAAQEGQASGPEPSMEKTS